MQRYCQSRFTDQMIPYDDGDYVLYSDAQAALAERDREIERLSGDLSANATMLSRQCDMAREAEGEALSLRREIAVLKHDIDAYRGALGYTVPGGHDGRLTDGTFPNNSIAKALNEQIAALSERFNDQAVDFQQARAQIAGLKAELTKWKDLCVRQGMEIKRLREALDGLNTVAQVLIKEGSVIGSGSLQGWCIKAEEAL